MWVTFTFTLNENSSNTSLLGSNSHKGLWAILTVQVTSAAHYFYSRCIVEKFECTTSFRSGQHYIVHNVENSVDIWTQPEITQTTVSVATSSHPQQDETASIQGAAAHSGSDVAFTTASWQSQKRNVQSLLKCCAASAVTVWLAHCRRRSAVWIQHYANVRRHRCADRHLCIIGSYTGPSSAVTGKWTHRFVQFESVPSLKTTYICFLYLLCTKLRETVLLHMETFCSALTL